jgi:hypothetical protein
LAAAGEEEGEHRPLACWPAAEEAAVRELTVVELEEPVGRPAEGAGEREDPALTAVADPTTFCDVRAKADYFRAS